MTTQDHEAFPPAGEASEDGAVPVPRGPVPDLGFFAGAPAPAATPFGSPAPAGAPSGAPAPFGTPAAPAPFGPPAAPASFGTAAAPAPFGAPIGAPSYPAPAHPSGLGGGSWKLLVAGAVVVVLVLGFFAGRFGWQQFVADPVVPDTLGGMPLLSAPGVAEQTESATAEMRSELGSGSAAKVGFYTNGQGAGYLLFSVRGGSRPGSSTNSDGTDPFAGWTKTEAKGATCWSQPAQTATGMGVTFCMKGLWRRAVIVMGLAATPMDPGTVAQVTDEAWAAQ